MLYNSTLLWQFLDVSEYDAEPQGMKKRLSGLARTNLTKRHTPAVSTNITTSVFFILFPYIVFILNESVCSCRYICFAKESYFDVCMLKTDPCQNPTMKNSDHLLEFFLPNQKKQNFQGFNTLSNSNHKMKQICQIQITK